MTFDGQILSTDHRGRSLQGMEASWRRNEGGWRWWCTHCHQGPGGSVWNKQNYVFVMIIFFVFVAFIFDCFFSTSCIQLKCFVNCSKFKYLAISKSIDRNEYTHDEVLQTRYRIGVMSEVEYRQARTRERWWVRKPSTTECWRNSSQRASSKYGGMTDLRRLMKMRWQNETRNYGRCPDLCVDTNVSK